MPPEAYKAASDAIAHTNSVIQLLVWVIIAVTVGIVVWILKLSGDSKKLVDAKETAEKERTAHRKAERDAEIKGMSARFDAEIKSLRDLFADHVEDHKNMDTTIKDSIGDLRARLCKIEDNVHSIDINIARMMMRFEMAETVRARHEPIG